MRAAIEGGVRKKVIVHAREGGFCLCADGELTRVASLNIPKDIIKGNVGAGDAFCAGALYGIYNGYTDKETLEFASGAAATSLLAENSVDGILSAEEIKEFALKYERSLI
jgi:sugar/nucleoside kinase (ribokinase family)